MTNFLCYLLCFDIATLLALVFYLLGRKDGYANGARYSETRYELGKRAGYETGYETGFSEGHAQGWAYRQKRMRGKP